MLARAARPTRAHGVTMAVVTLRRVTSRGDIAAVRLLPRRPLPTGFRRPGAAGIRPLPRLLLIPCSPADDRDSLADSRGGGKRPGAADLDVGPGTGPGTGTEAASPLPCAAGMRTLCGRG
ncbi:hypothetical protein GCM10010302_10550 [Streptomyces polychromogenes]|uniref:Uncharacterized protein n=1 Tax=Streptomyces polychromogenes TaxID=67342 RepID=A0ABN0V4N1_9ACTN